MPGGPTTDDDSRREVVVPDRLYKTVAVFSTLVAIVSVVLGFWFLSAAGSVLRNPTGSFFVGLLQAVGLSFSTIEPHLSALALAVGLVGLVLVAGGGWVFAMGSRFRTGGMAKPKDEADEESSDG
ncbi:hypothetical protein BRC81_13250 [Halobacteriales archaeon QS_1_68_20]|nr:MAG: hypothetical protein BRC81_13250 [Halobacteriales archaeon QS_1_68_20]